MKRWLMAVAVLAAGVAQAQTVDVTKHPDTSKWPSLFEADLSNAEFPAGVWTVEDGAFTASKDEALWTKRDYDHFQLDLEFKTADGSNSGVLLYVNDMKNWIPNSLEIQIADDYSHEWSSAPATWQCGAVFGHLAASQRTVKKPGEWNRYTITCKGPQVTVVLNGETIIDANLDNWPETGKNPDGTPNKFKKALKDFARSGPIGLQGLHGKAQAPVWYRNLKIKTLE